MITDRRYEYGALAGALVLAAVAAACVYHRLWPHAATFLLGTCVLLEAASRERRRYRRRRAEAQRAERLARPMHPVPPPLEPCCSLYRDSVQVGVSPVHSASCHRVECGLGSGMDWWCRLDPGHSGPCIPRSPL